MNKFRYLGFCYTYRPIFISSRIYVAFTLWGFNCCYIVSVYRDKNHIDILINNAGTFHPDAFDDIDFAAMHRLYDINTLGPLRVTQALAPLMGEGGKIGIITSRVGSLGDNGSGGMYAYRMSKAAVNMAGVSMAHDLRERGITVLLLHPGMVATEMTEGQGIPVEESVRGLIGRLEALDQSSSGTFWHANGKPLEW